MELQIITEIAYFSSMESIADIDFIKIIDDLEKEFHMKQHGYIGSELLKGNNSNQWIMIQHWDSLKNAKESSKNMMTTHCTNQFRNAIDPKSVKLSFFTQINKWK